MKYKQPVLEKPLTSVWIYLSSQNVYRCSRCHYVTQDNEIKTCPGCGASMRKSG